MKEISNYLILFKTLNYIPTNKQDRILLHVMYLIFFQEYLNMCNQSNIET